MARFPDFDEESRESARLNAARDGLLRLLRRYGVQSVQLALLIFLTAVPIPFLHFSDVRPAFLLMAAYHWAVFRPDVFPPAGAFACGLLLDLISASPFGLNALTLFAARHLTGQQKKFLSRQPFLVLWLCFALVSAGAFALQWAGYSAFYGLLAPPRQMIISACLTALFYPPVARMLAALDRRALDRDEAAV